MNLPYITKDDFIASRRPITDMVWQHLLDEKLIPADTDRGRFFVYAENFTLEERDGGFYPHAWWYSPARHETQEAAETSLYKWRDEWVN